MEINRGIACFSWRRQRLQTLLSPVSADSRAAAAAHLSATDEAVGESCPGGGNPEKAFLSSALTSRSDSFRMCGFCFSRVDQWQRNAWSPRRRFHSVPFAPFYASVSVHAVCGARRRQSSEVRRGVGVGAVKSLITSLMSLRTARGEKQLGRCLCSCWSSLIQKENKGNVDFPGKLIPSMILFAFSPLAQLFKQMALTRYYVP